jgi:hypothetical protein
VVIRRKEGRGRVVGGSEAGREEKVRKMGEKGRRKGGEREEKGM